MITAHQLLIAFSHLLIFDRTTIDAEYEIHSEIFVRLSDIDFKSNQFERSLFRQVSEQRRRRRLPRDFLKSFVRFGRCAKKFAKYFVPPQKHTFEGGLLGRARLSCAEFPTAYSRLSAQLALNLTVAKIISKVRSYTAAKMRG